MERAQLLARLQPSPASCSPQCLATAQAAIRLTPHRKGRASVRVSCETATATPGRTPAPRKRKYELPKIEENAERPWKHVIPSLDDFGEYDWFLKVQDWATFWEMFQRWLEYECDSGPPSWLPESGEKGERGEKGEDVLIAPTATAIQYLDPDHVELASARQEYYEKWFEIKDREQVLHAIDAVASVVYHLEKAGVPMPEKLVYLDPIGKFFKARRDREPIYVQPVPQQPEPEPDWEYPDKPWEEWDDFTFRVHMEKVKHKEAQYEAFMERLDQVGKYKHMEVTPETDLRLAAHQPEGRSSDMAHDDIMKVITKDGTCVDPFEVPYNIEDPFSVADVMDEVKWHPETEDFIRDMGRWVESEDDLPGLGRKEEKDATMSEEFNDLGDAFEEENAQRAGEDDGDQGGSSAGGGGPQVADEGALGYGGEEDDPMEPGGMDAEME